MIALIQRVSHASVTVAGKITGEVGEGVLALVGIEKADTEASCDRLLERMLSYRIFSDEQGKMNLSVRDIAGELLLVPQFTLAANTRKGTRPSFSAAAVPAEGRRLFEYVLREAESQVSTKPIDGLQMFGADMQVELLNDGPVTFWLQT